ncbi:MAG: homoserine dehydrogenase [Spirochaetota bacterium]|nr:homoserine dehydrogenase [Spirochaetota bacterium]
MIVNIGLIGFGTVGSGVYDLIMQNACLIKERTGLDLRIKTVCDIRTEDVKKKVGSINVINDWRDVITDKEIDTVVELIGGISPAKSIILESLKNGKNVVTANKKLLAEDGDEIFNTAGMSNSKLGFEASVGGGMPCILSLKYGLVGTRINTVIGILNGTTNYILTKMEDEGLTFEMALKDAQDKGFAEADPTFDIEGFDAGHKIALLSMLAYNRKVDFKSISIDGITKINQLDIEYAKEMGYVIKLLGISKLIGDEVDIRVHPAMLPMDHPLASVRNEFNAVMYITDMTGPVILYGKGAGNHPTASAVVSDIVQIARDTVKDDKALTASIDSKYLSSEKRLFRFYMRLSTEDRPGILSKISGVLAKYDISIASVIQKEIHTKNPDSKNVPLVIMTHVACEDKMLRSIDEINNFNFVEGKVTFIKVEDSLSLGDEYE